MLRILALAFTAVVLVPGGAHLFELPAKMGLDRDAYFTVQSIYAGWALFAVPIFIAIGANAALAFSLRRTDGTGAVLAGLAAVLIALTLAIFFVCVFPGNQATTNWTSIPDNWETLRRNWEYGHAVNALITFAAFLALAAAATRRTQRS